MLHIINLMDKHMRMLCCTASIIDENLINTNVQLELHVGLHVLVKQSLFGDRGTVD